MSMSPLIELPLPGSPSLRQRLKGLVVPAFNRVVIRFEVHKVELVRDVSLEEINDHQKTITVIVVDSRHTLFDNDRLDEPWEVDRDEQEDTIDSCKL